MLIVVEGVDGAGKTAASKILKEKLALRFPDQEIVNCRAPNGPIRGVLLDRPEGTIIDHETELLLFVTCHRWLLINDVLPALARGAIVVLDRFTDSTIAYQGGGRELGMNHVSQLLEQHVFRPFGASINPDYRIYVEANELVREKRLAQRAGAEGLDHMDKQGMAFRNRNADVMNILARQHEDTPNHAHGKTLVSRFVNNDTLDALDKQIDRWSAYVLTLALTEDGRQERLAKKRELISEKLAQLRRN